MSNQTIADRLRAVGCAVRERAPLSEATSFKIGGPALLAEVPTACAATAAACVREAGVPLLWLGKGSNVLVSDHGLSGAVLRLAANESDVRVDGTRVTVAAGVPLKTLCRVAREYALSGLEFAYGIPGAVGGGVYMNAGAYGGELKDALVQVTVLTPAGTVETRPAAALSMGYRHTDLMDSGEVVLSAVWELTPDDRDSIAARMEDYLSRRREKQPLEHPSAGSFFKRPAGHFAGALIEQCGLKGFRVGDAQVSEKHAGFVVNRGHATCEQVRELAAAVRARVHAQTGVYLEPEVRLLGERWPWE